MPFDPTERLPIGRSPIALTRLGLGGASIGGLFDAVTDDDALATMDRAWELGVRYFDTAPLYGYGNSERRMGRALRGRPRDTYTVSTKVGRLIRPLDRIPPGSDVDRQAFGGREDAFYAGVEAVRPVFDYSSDGVERSIEESLDRLGLDRIDIALIHDPDDHWPMAIGEAYPALHRLREQGTIGAIGVGMNQATMLARFAREGDFDLFMLAGRYTLFDQDGLSELLPVCLSRGIGVVIAGAMNSGLLAAVGPAARLDYRPAPQAAIERARRLEAICMRHGVPLKAAAIQFPLAHPAVVSLVAGVRSIDHLNDYPTLMRESIPVAMWADLKREGLIASDAPTPQ